MRRSFSTAHDKVWFTSDLHFGHEAMLRRDVCARPWDNVNDMDRALIDNWNNLVAEKDHIFVLGDVSFRSPTETLDILAHLKGKKYLIMGNHDKNMKSFCLEMFEAVADYHEIKVDSQPIVLGHYAFRSWNRMHYGAWNLHGHSHGNLPAQGKQMDVGIDAVAKELYPDGDPSTRVYSPISFENVQALLKTAPVVAVDHHVSTPE